MQRANVLLVSLIFFISCNGFDSEEGNGIIVTKENKVSEFNELEINGNFDITLTKSDIPSLTVTTDSNLHEHITVEQSGNMLELSSEKNLRSDHGVKVIVGIQDINVIEVGGASAIKNEGILAGDRLTVEMSGAGALKMAIDMKRLKVDVSGAGSVELTGKAEKAEISMSGAGGLDAQELICENVEVNISGVGGAHVYASEKLKASVSGVGGVTYSGNPKEVKKDVSGLGSVSPD